MHAPQAIHNHGFIIKNMAHEYHIIGFYIILKGKHQKIILACEDIDAAKQALLSATGNAKKDQLRLEQLQQHIAAHLAIGAKANFGHGIVKMLQWVLIISNQAIVEQEIVPKALSIFVTTGLFLHNASHQNACV